MKKVMRSPLLKATAFLLCILCIGAAVLVAGNGVNTVTQGGRTGAIIYQFEGDFANSWYIRSELRNAASILDNYIANTEPDAPLPSRDGIRGLSDFIGGYEVRHNGTTYSGGAAELDKAAYYLRISPGGYEGTSDYWVSYQMMDGSYYQSDVTDTEGGADESVPTYAEDDYILVTITDEQAASAKAQWEQSRQVVDQLLIRILGLFVLALAMFVYLLCVTGRRAEDDEIHLILIDRMYVEFNVALIVGVGLGVGALVIVSFDAIFSNGLVSSLLWAIAVAATLGGALLMELLLSLTRLLKNRSFVSRSFILCACRWCWNVVKRVWRRMFGGCKGLYGRIAQRERKYTLRHMLFGQYADRKTVLLLLAYSAALVFCATLFGAFLYKGDGLMLLFFLLILGACAAGVLFLYKRVFGFETIVQSIQKIRAGDLTHKIDIEGYPQGVLRGVAQDINSLGDGLQAALQNEIRAERMKSELITNVSHDLKTPLTSIINYSDLLCKEHLSPEEANDYAKIIYQKSNRLKNLTSDLFDISKVRSGAETILSERLDVCTLVRQALGEQDQAIEAGGLSLKVTMPDHEIPIWADGKKLSRVLENLIGNCAKYSMQGTRVFVTAFEDEQRAIIEIKNIANYAMDFDAEEITERFVRGDAARTTEGSGLGLAIAKSYVVACGGELRVDVDGDLFKVTIEFPIYGLTVS